ncbi:MAG: alpha-2-macroglobulin family protein [Chloracidobacterium sp.]
MVNHSVLVTKLEGATMWTLRCLLDCALLCFFCNFTQAQVMDYQTLKTEAERLYAEGSYELARQRYAQLDPSTLPAGEARWVRFRLADTDWRARAATTQSDFEPARAALDKLIGETPKPEDRDLTWAEAQASLGDFWWLRRASRNWYQAWPHYSAALDWWAHSKDLTTARDRYLTLLFRAAYAADDGWYGERVQPIPIATLDEAMRLVQSDDERAHLHYLTAMSLRQQGGDYESRARVDEEFTAALAIGKRTPWYDDALFHSAQWLESAGRPFQQPDGSFQMRPDYATALARYRQLIAAYRPGESRYVEDARNRITELTQPSLTLGVGNVFLPDSEIRFGLNWRNVKRIELALYAVDVTQDLQPTDTDASGAQGVNLTGRQPVKTLSRDGDDQGDYRPRQALITLDGPLPVGAYLLEARAGRQTARELVLVTDAALIAKADGRRLVVFASSALDGTPLPNARLRVWFNGYDRQRSRSIWTAQTGTTDRDGLVTFEKPADQGHTCLIFAMAGARPALCLNTGGSLAPDPTGWKIYAFTDRAAYRPGDPAQWKIVARQLDGKRYRTPVGEAIGYELLNPRGEKVAEGTATLSQFGGAWGVFQPDATWPLGEYLIRFGKRQPDGAWQTVYGEATLFRLEEYKLPEFRVTVTTPEENGRRKTFRAGDRVEVAVAADYYFGGAVAGGRAEIIISEQPLYRPVFRRPEVAWFDEEAARFADYDRGSRGRIIRRETLTLDANGRAQVVIPTPRFASSDLEYRIEARVMDASRREVTGQATLRVGRQRFAVEARPEHRLHRPGENIAVTFYARDINDQPVAAEGLVTVTREIWKEIWLDARGRERTAAEAAARPEAGPYRIKQRGYEREELLKQTVKTDPERGMGALAFTAPKEGFYRVMWVTPEPNRNPITTDTTVWVSTTATTDTGYVAADLDIIADRDTLAVGRTVPILLVAPTSGRTVLLSTVRDGLGETRVIRMTGTAKLVELEITDRDTPNFQLEADSLLDLRLSQARRDFTVPPTGQILDVQVTADRAEVQPRESATFTIVTRDATGAPRPAEVAFAVTDDAVSAIQSDYAPDPRRFFHGTKRQAAIVTTTSLQYRPYARLKPQPADPAADRPANELAVEAEGGRDMATESVPRPAPGARAQTSEVAGMRRKEAARSELAADAAAEDGGSNVIVRSDFRATAFWQPNVVTGPDGRATVTVTFPDSLTTWKAMARAASATGEVGQATAQTQTNQPLIVRLQTPRFLVTDDRATVSAVVNNRTNQPATVTVTLAAQGVALDPDATRRITVPPQGEARADWSVTTADAGNATFTVTAVGDTHRDAMTRTLPAYRRGIEKFVAQSGQVRAPEATFQLNLPRERDNTRVVARMAPSLAVTMLDALPYLLDYPYGCTEQTMSRFLPAVIVAKTLREQGLPPEAIAGRLFGGIEAASAAKTHPGGQRNLAELDRIARQGLTRLYDFQKSDGSWGWWKETESDRFMTAYVVWGLALAKQAGLEVRPDALARGVAFLEGQLVAEENAPDRQAWLLHALAEAHHAMGAGPVGPPEQAALENLWKQRDRLSAYGRALYALAAHHYGADDRARVLVRNLANGVVRDTAPNSNLPTARWGAGGFWYRWTDSPVETTAFVLRALVTIDPANELVTPAMNWLVKNRRGAQWSNTRDTAISVLALNDYLRASGETAGPVEYEVVVNGTVVAKTTLTPRELLTAPAQIVVPENLLRDGVNDIQVRKRQGAALYVSAEATFFSRESPIPAAGNEIYVKRQYWRLIPRPTLLRGVVYERVALRDGDAVNPGDRLLCVMTVEAKNDYEYLVFEDLKPAGFEAVQVRSGIGPSLVEVRPGTDGRTGRACAAYQELRDRHLALFVDRLPQGVWQVEYELRAETPGRFSALPTLGHAMYVPEIRANGTETRVVVAAGAPETAERTGEE